MWLSPTALQLSAAISRNLLQLPPKVVVNSMACRQSIQAVVPPVRLKWSYANPVILASGKIPSVSQHLSCVKGKTHLVNL